MFSCHIALSKFAQCCEQVLSVVLELTLPKALSPVCVPPLWSGPTLRAGACTAASLFSWRTKTLVPGVRSLFRQGSCTVGDRTCPENTRAEQSQVMQHVSLL